MALHRRVWPEARERIPAGSYRVWYGFSQGGCRECIVLGADASVIFRGIFMLRFRGRNQGGGKSVGRSLGAETEAFARDICCESECGCAAQYHPFTAS